MHRATHQTPSRALTLVAALSAASFIRPPSCFADDPTPCRILFPEGAAAGAYAPNLWPMGTVPYEFDDNVSADNQQKAIDAMIELESVAGIAFVPHLGQPNWLVIQDADSNSSFVGMQGGPQPVNIASWNFHYIIAHELIHALGAWHEHQRPDRDSFVQINWGTIQPTYDNNFVVAPPPVTMTGSYDFDSVMHYGDCTFSVCCPSGTKCPCPLDCATITVLPPNEAWQDDIGQRDHLSDGDIAGLVAMYPCDPSGGCPCDYLSLGSILWEESGGDNDGTPECGESANVQISLCTKADVQSVDAVLIGPSQCVQMTDPDVDYGAIGAGQCAAGDFSMNVIATQSCFPVFALHVEYGYEGIPCFQDFFFEYFFCCDCPVSFELCDTEILVVDDCNGNGALDSGERAQIRASLKNTGQIPAFDPDAWLSCIENVQLDCGPSQELRYPDLLSGAPCAFPEDPSIHHWEVEIPEHEAGIWDTNILVMYDGAPAPFLVPQPVTINAGVQGWMKTNPQTHDFGTSGTDQDVALDVSISNIGTAPFLVTGVMASQSDTKWVGPASFTVDPGASQAGTIVINTALLSCEQITRQVTFESDACVNDPGEDDQITIVGLVCDAWPVFGLEPSVGTFSSGLGQIDVSGATIVWTDNRNGNSDIYANDLAGRREYPVTTHPAAQSCPRISGTKVAWTDRRNAPSPDSIDFDDIYAIDLGAGMEFPVSMDPADERLVGVDGEFVAYIRKYYDLPSGSDPHNLYLYNWRTGQTTQITSFTHDGFNPMGNVQDDPDEHDMGGGLIGWREETLVWDGDSWISTDQKVRIYDIDRGADDIIWNSFPNGLSANNGKVVWSSNACGDDNVFLWEKGSVEQITCFDDEHELPAVGCSAIVYRLHFGPDYPLLYWDLNANQSAVILPSANSDPNVAEDWRMDSNPCDVLVYRAYNDNIYYAFINHADPSVSAASIESSEETPYENRPFEFLVTVSNLTIVDAPAPINVELYDGDPDIDNDGEIDPNAVLLEKQVIPTLPGHSQVEAIFAGVEVIGSGPHQIFTLLVPAFPDNPGNNEAFLELDVLATGGCCLDDWGTCMSDTTPSECSALGGTYEGDTTDCTTAPCPIIGSCCFFGQTCQEGHTEESCIGVGGEFQGAGTTCTTAPCPVPCPWDITEDGIVNVGDLVLVITMWGPCPGCAADVTGDSVVDVQDLIEVIINWGPCR